MALASNSAQIPGFSGKLVLADVAFVGFVPSPYQVDFGVMTVQLHLGRLNHGAAFGL